MTLLTTGSRRTPRRIRSPERRTAQCGEPGRSSDAHSPPRSLVRAGGRSAPRRLGDAAGTATSVFIHDWLVSTWSTRHLLTAAWAVSIAVFGSACPVITAWMATDRAIVDVGHLVPESPVKRVRGRARCRRWTPSRAACAMSCSADVLAARDGVVRATPSPAVVSDVQALHDVGERALVFVIRDGHRPQLPSERSDDVIAGLRDRDGDAGPLESLRCH